MIKRYLKYLILIPIIFNIFLASRWVIDGNIFFHTDIARDFLLMEDIVENKNLTLLGPRSGAIPGLFHGPFWLYLNIPAFIAGEGDPVFVGLFSVILYILSLVFIYYAGRKMFGREEGMLAALLLSSVTILHVRSLFNPYGALLLSPLFFYFFISYLKDFKIKNLVLSFLILGFIIQFQMAFGVPILLLLMPYLIYYLIKNKKIIHLVSSAVLIIPLSSFLIFDLRNQFIQLKSLSSYVLGSQSHGKLSLDWFQLLTMRIKESAVDGLGAITQNNLYLTILLIFVFILGIFRIYKKGKDSKVVTFVNVFLFFYFGFWFFTIFFKGPVWNYYYLPFIPLIILFFVLLKRAVNKIIFYSIFILVYSFNLYTAFLDIGTYNPDASKSDVSTWKFNKLVAQKVFDSRENEFGYFIFTPDLYGYSPRYALNYYQKKILEKKVYPYEKKTVTYLVIAPAPEYGKDPNSLWYQKNTNSGIWRSNDIRISKDPDFKFVFENGFVIEKYNLSDEETKLAPNPYLIKDIFFR